MICRLFSIYCFVLFLVSVRFATVSSPFRTNAIWWASTEGRTIPHSYHWEHETRALTPNRPEKNPPSLSSFSHSLSLSDPTSAFCTAFLSPFIIVLQKPVRGSQCGNLQAHRPYAFWHVTGAVLTLAVTALFLVGCLARACPLLLGHTVWIYREK